MSAVPLRVRFRFTRRDAVLVLWETLGRRWAQVAVPLVLLATLLLAWAEASWRGAAWPAALLRASWLPALLALASAYVFVRLPGRAFDRLPPAVRDATWELEFGEQRLEQSAGAGSTQTIWAVWGAWIETRRFVTLLPADAGSGKARLAIPKRAFATPADLDALRDLLARKLGPRPS